MTEPKRKKRRFKTQQLGLTLFTLLVMAAIVFVAYNYFFPKEEEFVLNFYTYAAVDTMDFLEGITTSGTIRPATIEKILAPADAKVAELYVREGDDVTEGDLLLRLAAPDLTDHHQKAVAELDDATKALDQLRDDQQYELQKISHQIAEAESNLVAKQTNLELQTTLYQLGVIARYDLDKAKQELNSAQQTLLNHERERTTALRTHENALEKAIKAVSDAETSLEEITTKIANLDVIAPISGRILTQNTRLNSETKAAETLLEIADLSSQFIHANVNVSQAERFSIGSMAEITIGQVSYPALVSYISPQAQQTQDGTLVEIHLELETDPAAFRPNSNVTATIHLGIYRDSLYLPRGAYLTSGQQLFTYVIEGDTAVQKDVRFGLIQGNNIQILSGLEAGDLVITSTYDQFRHLEEIQILPEGGRKL